MPASVFMSGCWPPPAADAGAGSTTTSASDRYIGVRVTAYAVAAATTTRVTARIQRACAIRNRDHEPGVPGPRPTCRATSLVSSGA